MQPYKPTTPDVLADLCGLASLSIASLPERRREFLLRGQLVSLQVLPERVQDELYHEFAALHLPALAQAFRSNNSIMSTSVMMLNVISHTPYFSRFLRSDAGKGMAILHARRMAAHPADSPLQGEELGEATQFLSTLLVYQGKEGISQGDIHTLTPKLQRWKTERVDSGGVLGVSADRCRAQLSPNFATSMMFRMMKAKFEKDLYECAFEGCTRRRPHGSHELPRCGRCKCTIYCGQEHQKQDWPSHKKLCFKPSF